MKYVSELKELENKKFDSVKELEAAEKEIAKKQVEKEKAAKERKAEALVVEDAFKARNAAKKEYIEKKRDLYAKYEQALVELKNHLKEDEEAADKVYREKEEAYNKALNEFIEKHPEGYHMTLKDGDNEYTISSTKQESNFQDFFSAINSLFDSILF